MILGLKDEEFKIMAVESEKSFSLGDEQFLSETANFWWLLLLLELVIIFFS